MKKSIATLALLILAQSAFAGGPVLNISVAGIGDYHTGVELPDEVQKLTESLQDSNDIVSMISYSTGRCGGIDICVELSSTADQAKIEQAYREIGSPVRVESTDACKPLRFEVEKKSSSCDLF
jgi:hypothetical protein